MRKQKPLPPQTLITERFTYDPDTGELRWRCSPPHSGVKVGAIAGSVWTGGNGYGLRHYVKINNKVYLRSRIIWQYVYGVDPGDMVIDHINHNTLDDRLENLRCVSQYDNSLNRTDTEKNGGLVISRGILTELGKAKMRKTSKERYDKNKEEIQRRRKERKRNKET